MNQENLYLLEDLKSKGIKVAKLVDQGDIRDLSLQAYIYVE